jgi:hypothetical protein
MTIICQPAVEIITSTRAEDFKNKRSDVEENQTI